MKKNGFVAGVVAITYDSGKCPSQISLCELFRRFCLGLFVIWPFIAITTGVALVTGFFFGYRPAWYSDDKDTCCASTMAPYRHWPRIRGWRIQPWLICVILVIAHITPSFISFVRLLSNTPEVWMLAYIFGVGVGVLFFVVLWRVFSKTEMTQLFRQWLRAKKEKVCPVITFED